MHELNTHIFNKGLTVGNLTNLLAAYDILINSMVSANTHPSFIRVVNFIPSRVEYLYNKEGIVGQWSKSAIFTFKHISDPTSLIELSSLLKRLETDTGVEHVFPFTSVVNDKNPGRWTTRYLKTDSNNWLRSVTAKDGCY